MSSNIEKEILKTQYETMIRMALENQKKNTTPYKDFIAFVGSFVLSCFFTWCSSGDTSFFPKLFAENVIVRNIVCFLPFIAIMIHELLVVVSAKRIKKQIDSGYEMCMSSWRKRFEEFILEKVGYEPNIDTAKNIKIIKEKVKNHKDIVFDEITFANYLEKYYEKYKFDVYFDFYQHLAKVILLEKEISGTLIFDKGQYTFAVKNGTELLTMSALYK